MVPKECFCHIVVDIGYWAPNWSWRMKVCLQRGMPTRGVGRF